MRSSYIVNGHTATFETGIYTILRKMQERNTTVVKAKFAHERTNGKEDKRAKPCVVVWRDYWTGMFVIYGNGVVAHDLYTWILNYNHRQQRDNIKPFDICWYNEDLSEFGNIDGEDY